MHRIVRTAFVVVAMSLATAAWSPAQQDMSDVQIETIHVAGGVYMLIGQGGNIGLSVGDDGPFVIDDQFAPLTDKIRAAIAAVSDGDVRFVLNTHWHGDHTGGNENFGTAGAMIVAHENVRRRMNPAEFRDVMGRTQQAPPEALPVVTFTDAVNMYWNDENIRVFHVEAAHTDGDVIIHFSEANVVHMGDNFFRGRYPFIDVDSGGGIDGMIEAGDRVLSMVNSETQIIPGHGPLSTPADLRDFRDMLITVRDRVRTMLNDGMSIDEIVAAKPTSDLDATWGQNPDRFVTMAARSLSGQ